MKRWLGIDPGVSGALVLIDDEGDLVASSPMPVAGPAKHRRIEARAFNDLLGSFSHDFDGDCVAIVETMVFMPGRGAIGAVTSGLLFGAMAALIELRNWPLLTVHSKAWQKSVGGIPTKPKVETEDPKERARASAAHRKNCKEVITLKARLACPELALAMDKLKSKAEGFPDAYYIAQWGRRQ